MRKFFLAFDKKCRKFEEASAVFFVSLVLLVGGAQVVMRYVFNSSLSWSEEFIRYIFIWALLTGSSLTFRDKGHVKIDFVTNAISPKLRKICYYISNVCVIIMLLILIPSGLGIAIDSANSKTAALQISRFWVFFAAPVGGIMMLSSVITGLLKEPYEDEVEAHNRQLEEDIAREAKESNEEE